MPRRPCFPLDAGPAVFDHPPMSGEGPQVFDRVPQGPWLGKCDTRNKAPFLSKISQAPWRKSNHPRTLIILKSQTPSRPVVQHLPRVRQPLICRNTQPHECRPARNGRPRWAPHDQAATGGGLPQAVAVGVIYSLIANSTSCHRALVGSTMSRSTINEARFTKRTVPN